MVQRKIKKTAKMMKDLEMDDLKGYGLGETKVIKLVEC